MPESLELSSLSLTLSLSKSSFNLTKGRVISVVCEVCIPSSVYICHQGQPLKPILSGHCQESPSCVLRSMSDNTVVASLPSLSRTFLFWRRAARVVCFPHFSHRILLCLCLVCFSAEPSFASHAAAAT